MLGAVAAANRLLEVISRPIDVGGQLVAHSGSVGIAVSEDPNANGEDLLGQADIALYAAKSQGRNQTVVFDHHLEANVAERSSIELLLRKALNENAFRVLYQPEFDLDTGRMLAVEALVRWEREGHGLVAAATSCRWPRRPTSSWTSTGGSSKRRACSWPAGAVPTPTSTSSCG